MSAGRAQPLLMGGEVMFCRTTALGGLLFASACIASPAFETLESAPSGGAVGQADDMALIPATTLDANGVKPAAKADGKDKGDCAGKKGKCNDPESGGRGPSGGGDAGAAGGETPPPLDGSGAASSAAVVVPAFLLDLRETSVREYAACVRAGACSATGSGEGCTAPAGLAAHPVNCVTRAQAATFCAWKNKRLVRNLEWSAAAAGSASRAFPWGAQPPSSERLNACGVECSSSGMYDTTDGFVATAPAGSFPAGGSSEGVFDLAGNVAEWVDAAQVVRGGSYADVESSSVRALAARDVSPDASAPTIGFRCARDR